MMAYVFAFKSSLKSLNFSCLYPCVCLCNASSLCINYIGQAMQRAADSKQRRG